MAEVCRRVKDIRDMTPSPDRRSSRAQRLEQARDTRCHGRGRISSVGLPLAQEGRKHSVLIASGTAQRMLPSPAQCRPAHR